MTGFKNSLTRRTLRCLSVHMPYFNGKKRNGQNRIIRAGEVASEKLVIHILTLGLLDTIRNIGITNIQYVVKII